MISLQDSQIIDILPDNLKSAEVIALSYAIQCQNRKILSFAKKINIIAMINDLPESVLDLMAAEYMTQYYSSALDLDIKRNLVRNTLLWHTKAGTITAVEELINTIFGYGKLEEWYTYNGEPYHFKISVDTVLSSSMLAQFAKILQKTKNVRSVMDGFNKHNNLKNSVGFASGIVRTKHIRIGG